MREVPQFDCKAGRHNWEYIRNVFMEKRFLFWKYVEQYCEYRCLDCKTITYEKEGYKPI